MFINNMLTQHHVIFKFIYVIYMLKHAVNDIFALVTDVGAWFAQLIY